MSRTLLSIICLSLGLGACFSDTKTMELECTQNVGEACHKLGKDLESKDVRAAQVFYQRACDLKNTNGCVGLARLLEKAGSDPKPPLRSACDRGNTQACVLLSERIAKELKN